MSWRGRIGLLAAVVTLSAPAATRAKDVGPPPGVETPTVQKGLAWLRSHEAASPGEAAIAGLAMAKCGVTQADPALKRCVDLILTRVSGSTFTPPSESDHDLYEASIMAMALVNVDPKAYAEQIQGLANYIVGRQSPNGCWDYPSRTDRGDTSVSQYALLGLVEAVEVGGAKIPPQVWDKAARWLIATQQGDGAWVYRAEEPGRGQGGPSISMTGAGIGGLLICQTELVDFFKANQDKINPLLIPIEPDGGKRKYVAAVTQAAIEGAANRGVSWISSHFQGGNSSAMGQTPYYGLYGIERVTAFWPQQPFRPGGRDWFAEGKTFVVSSQAPDGHWEAMHGAMANTCWAILYYIRANNIIVKHIKEKRLGAGNLLGGRGLPKNLSDITVAGGRIVVRPMNGAVEGMLKVLEDPKAENADSALAGLVTEYDKRGARALIPLKDRFRKLLSDRDPGVRRVAAWALPRTGELDVIPTLIAALRDDDPEFRTEVRNGLQLLARKVEGFGPPPDATPDQRQEAIRQWREWYNAIRPVDQAADQDTSPGGGPAPAPAAAASR